MGAFDIEQKKWQRIRTENGPGCRDGATYTWAGDKILIFGGVTREGAEDRFPSGRVLDLR